MKKFLAILLAIVMVLSLCACKDVEQPAKKYKIKSVKIEGVDISEFELYTQTTYEKGHFANPDAPVFDLIPAQDAFYDALNVDLPASTTKGDGNYIVIDPTGTLDHEFSITIEGGNVIIKGTYNSALDGVNYFVDGYLQSFKTENVEIADKDDVVITNELKTIYTKEQLMTVLTNVYNDSEHAIVGQQMDGRAYLSELLAIFDEETTEQPGIVGMDLGMQGYGSSPLEWNAADRSKHISDIVSYVSNGGIFTLTNHMDNPSKNYGGQDNWCKGYLGYDDTKAGYEKAFADLITKGTELNTEFHKELDAMGKFLQDLRDNGVVVVFRPFHEMNGSWFWWCTSQNGKTVDSSAYVNLWKYVHDYYTKDLGLDNLIWIYSPNVASGNMQGGTMNTMYDYPGDEYVDMVGVDWYTGKKDLEIRGGNCYTGMVEETGKIGAICEFGGSGNRLAASSNAQDKLYNAMDALDEFLTLVDEGYKFSYIMHWTDEIFCGITSMGHGFEFMQDEFTLGQAEVKELFDELNKK